MRKFKRISALVLSMIMLLSVLSTVFAADPVTTTAAASNGKEEVVYIMTDASGAVNSINVVNIFTDKDVTDYGPYTSVKMLTTDDPITMTDDKITFTTEADKVYYQGTLENVQIPWDISIRYFLDGKELTPAEVYGQTGRLRIAFTITQNPDCNESFFKNYALQASFTLNSETCHDISAVDATFANVGKNKQLTYTILPGKGIETEITAEVSDFSMEAVAINGVALNLNIEIDDAELMDKVTELMNATSELTKGAGALSGGTQELKSGSEILRSGTQDLYSGASALDNGVGTLRDGILTVQDGLDSLNGKSSQLTDGSTEVLSALRKIQTALSKVSADASALDKLVSSSGQIKIGIKNLESAVTELQDAVSFAQFKAILLKNGLNLDTVTNGNKLAAAQLREAANNIANISVPTIDSSGVEELVSMLNTLATNQVVAELLSPILTEINDFVSQLNSMKPMLNELETLKGYSSSLREVATLLEGNNSTIGAVETYFNELSSNIAKLKSGVTTLKTNYTELDKGIRTLANSTYDMLTNLGELKSGINQLVTEYKKLDSGITAYTSGVATIVSGYSQLTTGVSALASATKELMSGAGNLSDGAMSLYDGVSSLCEGASELASGTEEFNSETSTMDSQIEEKVSQILSSIGGDDFVPESFVSEKNENVKSVQFVIKTDAISAENASENNTETEKPLTFWQKLLKLFGLYKPEQSED